MGNDDEKGHTAALDLKDLEAGISAEKETNRDWDPIISKPKSQWTSDEWSGDLNPWPNDFEGGQADGPSSGTAMIDIENIEEALAKVSQNQKPKTSRNAYAQKSWAEEEGDSDVPLLDYNENEFKGTPRKDDIRSEDGRLFNQSKKAVKDFDINQYDSPSINTNRRPSTPKRPLEASSQQLRPNPGPKTPSSTARELEPDECTVAINIDSLKSQGNQSHLSQRPTPMAQVKTIGIGIEDLNQSPPPSTSKVFEATQAMSIPANLDGPLTADALRAVLNKKISTSDSTTIIDTEALNAQEVHTSQGMLIIFLPDGSPPKSFQLRPGVTNIGRAGTNHLVLPDRFISRKHLLIKQIQGRFEMVDSGSDNRTLVNDMANANHVLSRGDLITIGSTQLRFIEGEPLPSDLDRPAPPPPMAGPSQAIKHTGPVQTQSQVPTLFIIILGLLIFLMLVLLLIIFFVFV